MSSLPLSGSEPLRIPTGPLYICPVCLALPAPRIFRHGPTNVGLKSTPHSALSDRQETNKNPHQISQVGQGIPMQEGQGPRFKRPVRRLWKIRVSALLFRKCHHKCGVGDFVMVTRIAMKCDCPLTLGVAFSSQLQSCSREHTVSSR